jgi:hypothetical protein
MKHRSLYLGAAMLLCAGLLCLPGCSKKQPEAAGIAAWEQFQDSYEKIGFSYPQGWTLTADAGKYNVYNDSAAVEKFIDPKADAPDGVQLAVARERLEEPITLEAYVTTFKNDKEQAGWEVKKVETKKLDGTEARAITYVGAFDAKTKLTATRVVTLRDSLLYYVELSGYNDMYAPYAAVLDTAVATLRLPRQKTAEELANPALPSQEWTRFDNFAISIQHPDNFDPTTRAPKGDVQFDLELKGMRQDCSIRIDLRPAKGLTVEKVFEQNAGKFSAFSRGESKIDGVRALYLVERPAKDTERRVYFVVKNDKFARVFLTYNQPLKGAFLPVFERSLGTLRIK